MTPACPVNARPAFCGPRFPIGEKVVDKGDEIGAEKL